MPATHAFARLAYRRGTPPTISPLVAKDTLEACGMAAAWVDAFGTAEEPTDSEFALLAGPFMLN